MSPQTKKKDPNVHQQVNKQTAVSPFKEILGIKRNQLLTQTATWMDLKTIKPTECRSVVA